MPVDVGSATSRAQASESAATTTASSTASLSLPDNLTMTSSLIAEAAIVNHQVAAQQGRGPFSETPSDTRAPVLKSTTGVSYPGLRRFGRGSRRK